MEDRVVTHTIVRGDTEDVQRRFEEHTLHHISILIVVAPRLGSISLEVKSIVGLALVLEESGFYLYQTRINSIIYIAFVLDDLELIVFL